MSLDTKALADQILVAMRNVVAAEWPSIATLAAGEAIKLAQTLATIEQLSAAKQIGPEAAAILLDMQEHATRAVLLSTQGIALIVAQKAINAALQVIAGTVNAAIGFPLL